MNIEETKEAIKVMQAFVDGKTLEYKRHDGVWMLTTLPCWNWNSIEYRIKPTEKLRPWTPDEVPLGAQMRFRLIPSERHLITHSTLSLPLQQWLEDREHSTDGGKTWLPCGVVEDVK